MRSILTILFIAISLLLNAQSFSSHFVPMSDGIKLAVDVHLAKVAQGLDKVRPPHCLTQRQKQLTDLFAENRAYEFLN